jgi:hypothetical protein
MRPPVAIPYDPTWSAIAAIAAFALFLPVAILLCSVSVTLVVALGALFATITGLLTLRRLVWKRTLVVGLTSFEVPYGFLRLRRGLPLRYDEIVNVHIAPIPLTAIVCIRTADRQVEVQDIYFPDQATFREFLDFLWSLSPARQPVATSAQEGRLTP